MDTYIVEINENEIERCVNDILKTYEKEKQIGIRNKIVSELESAENLSKEEVEKLEKELNEVIIKLAKMK